MSVFDMRAEEIDDNYLKKLFTLLSYLLLFTAITGLVVSARDLLPSEQWNRTFGGAGYDAAYSVEQTPDGGYIVTGFTKSYGSGEEDMWIIKTDANGFEQWNRTFGGTKNERAFSLQRTSDGSYIFAGHTESYGAGGEDVWLVKTDVDGHLQWSKTFGGMMNDGATFVQQTPDGGYIVAGAATVMEAAKFGEFTLAHGQDALLLKIDSSGNEQWNRTFGSLSYPPVADVATSVQQLPDGGYVLAGVSIPRDDSDAWLMKTDINGNKQWELPIGGAKDDALAAVRLTVDGGYILGGRTVSFGAGGYDFWLIKTDSGGNQQWTRTFGGTKNDVLSSVRQTMDGGYILAGSTDQYATPPRDAWIIKTDANGNELWNFTFGGEKDDAVSYVQQTPDGGYVLAGYTESFGRSGVAPLSGDAWLIKVLGEVEITSTSTPDLTPIITPAATSMPEATKAIRGTSGFEAALAITGILMIAFLMRLKK